MYYGVDIGGTTAKIGAFKNDKLINIDINWTNIIAKACFLLKNIITAMNIIIYAITAIFIAVFAVLSNASLISWFKLNTFTSLLVTFITSLVL